MKKLTIAGIGTLEQYLQQRPAMRQAIMEHKKSRRVHLGPAATLHFEDYLTMKYQVQEMMRAQQLREMAAINEELDAYNPLIPDGSNLKCTLMLEFADAAERRQQLQKLCGIEQQIFIQIEGFEAVAAIADEDLQRTSDGKTSAVHFMRYEFSPQMISAAKNGANWTIYSTHAAYQHRVEPLPELIVRSLCRDFD